MTYVAVLKACAQLGDIQTAYDALKELKINNLQVNEHIFNQLIKVYAGASNGQFVQDKHIDLYIKDAMELFTT